MLAPVLVIAACGREPVDLDLIGYQNRVCDLLAIAQLARIGITRPEIAGDDPARHVCLWQTSDTKIKMSLDSPVEDACAASDTIASLVIDTARAGR